MGLSIGFDEDNNWKLSEISIKSEYYELKNHRLIGLSKENLTSFLKSIEFNDVEFEDCALEEFPTHERIYSKSFGMNFWFDNDKLTEVQWGPLFMDENTLIWPK